MSLRQLELKLRFLAKQIAPIDTGNLVDSITSTSSSNRIDIYYRTNQAPYTEYLEDGTRYSGKHVGFISQDTVYAVSKYTQDYFNNARNSETLNIGLLAQKTRNTPARQQQFLRSIAR